MSAPTTKVTVVVLSEDGGASGWGCIHRLARKTLDLMVDNLAWGTAIQLTPRGEVPQQVQLICSGNRWKGGDASNVTPRNQLFRYVANKLLSDDATPQFVVFHVDADRVWSGRERSPSDNVKKFDDVVRVGVRQHLVAALAARNEPERIEPLMARLYTFVPYVEVEAWLYQATAVASGLCRQRACERHLAQYDAWAADRARLDKVPNLKEARTERDLHCLRDEDKDALAARFDAQAVYDAGASYQAAVDAWMGDAFLMGALKRAKWERVGD